MALYLSNRALVKINCCGKTIYQPSGAISTHTYSAAVTTLSDTARTYSDYSGPRGGVAASRKIPSRRPQMRYNDIQTY